MPQVTTFSQLQTTTARLASFVAAALSTIAEAISEIEITDVSISNATTNQAGLMSATDKRKLDSLNLDGTYTPSTTTSSTLILGGVESTTEGVMWVESATELGNSTFALGTTECAESAIFIGSGGNRYQTAA